MPVSTAILLAIAAVLAFITWRRPNRPVGDALHLAARQLTVVAPRILFALLTASFVAQLLPTDDIAAWLNPERGWVGLLVAAGFGTLIPGGAVISIPIALLLSKAGAGLPQIMTFLTSWSIFAIHRVVVYEIPTVGWRFAVVRLSSALAFPFVMGIMAGLFTSFVTIG